MKKTKHILGQPISGADRALLDRVRFLASRGGLVCPEGTEVLDGDEHDDEFLRLLNGGIQRGFNLPEVEDACDCKMCLEMNKQAVWEQFQRLKVV